MDPDKEVQASVEPEDNDNQKIWEELEKTAFDRIIASTHDFCLFMRDLFVPDEAILIPPEGGCPEITTESFASLEEDDKVINVLRHMTYMKRYCTGDNYRILRDTGMCNWQDAHVVQTITRGDGKRMRFMTETPKDPVPSDVIGLCDGGRACGILLLNCTDGIVHWYGCAEFASDAYDECSRWAREEDDLFRCGRLVRWPVEEFFKCIKGRFRSMEQLPKNGYEVLTSEDEGDGHMRTLKDVYKRYGWPDNFQKAECAAAVKELEEKLRREYFAERGPLPALQHLAVCTDT